MNILWSPEAVQDLVSLRDYIAQDSSKSAAIVVNTILEFIEQQLTQFPNSGRKGRVKGTLELLVPRLPFIIPYRLKENNIEIIRIYHNSRQWPESF
ncbi:MAG: type II toxin-antitoxin system RelE/ParE family toxin [Proteobacteria bacterium]|nr:type II toxin-antitoxin system RelE/ParE family toxin [Pseudomonadota bacterium]